MCVCVCVCVLAIPRFTGHFLPFFQRGFEYDGPWFPSFWEGALKLVDIVIERLFVTFPHLLVPHLSRGSEVDREFRRPFFSFFFCREFTNDADATVDALVKDDDEPNMNPHANRK